MTVVTHLSGASPGFCAGEPSRRIVSAPPSAPTLTPVSPASLVFLSVRLVQLRLQARAQETSHEHCGRPRRRKRKEKHRKTHY